MLHYYSFSLQPTASVVLTVNVETPAKEVTKDAAHASVKVAQELVNAIVDPTVVALTSLIVVNALNAVSLSLT